MKKVFTKARYLLALVSLVLLGTNAAWAEETITVKWFDSSSNTFSAVGVASNPNVLTVNDAANSSDITMNSVKQYATVYWTQLKCGTATDKNKISLNDYVTFKVTVNSGYKFTPTGASAYAIGEGTGNNAAKLYEGTTTSAVSAAATNSSSAANASALTVTPAAKTYEEGESFFITLYVGAQTTTGDNPKPYVDARDVVITGTYVSTGAPTIEALNTEITTKESGVATTVDIDVTGSNLTGSTLTAKIEPAVDGLSVLLDNSTITSGSISAKATLTYTATENAKGQTTLVLSDGVIEKNVIITYKAKVMPTELQTISETTIWDIVNDVTGTIEYTDDTDKNAYHVYADIDELSFNSTFNAEALEFKGQFPRRPNNTFAQAGSFHFKTSCPGKVKVTFSGTGSDASGRYVKVNEVTGIVEVSGTSQLSEEFYVGAGDVIVEGTNSLRYYKIEFTPVTSIDITINNGKGYRTFASKYPTDWSSVEDVTAYTAKVSGSEVIFEQVTGIVPAGEGLLLKGEDETYTIPTAATTPEDFVNDFVGVTSETKVKGSIFILYDGEQGVGFYKTTAEEFTVGANTAYIPASVADARTFISLDGETTGIDAAIVNNEKAAGVYNLNGQRVAQPTKGLYIVNGKKVVIK